MARVILIMNPSAGGGKLNDNLNVIRERLEEIYATVDIHLTSKPGDGADYINKNAHKTDVVIGAGGDGTIYELINALSALDKRPKFAIIPGGTANDFSRAVGMSQNPLIALDQILEGKEEQVDVGHSAHQYFLNFWGIGLITQVSENIESNKKDILGKLSYYMSAAQTVKEAKPFHLKLDSKEQDFDGKAVMVIVGNGPFTGGLQAFFPKNNLQDGLFDVLILKGTSLPAFWSILRSSMAKEEWFNEEEVIHFQTSELTLDCDPVQVIDCDGEKYYRTPTKLKVLPEHLTMIVGEYLH
ncbi:YegS/Rv2252/BmrU family lipid kinase [Scopulibacillus darangshiensis]|uniref:YegS/Rv2252/BmrU family lipid kinase n=1 Tax=Scopulibacillus darangshiensis TaxID=442528 RepID=A0A4R2NG16_9BACL|nr:diacylglycerol kinase family protein [Scopulibacillus darangshiensis]TCP20293.1 YegS/Rv2252/BmrU family lipid kinase [Scopulibacillus darangshiensis]